MASATARRRRAIEHLVATDLGRARLARAAFDAVVDGLDLGPIALRTAGDRAWVQEAVAGPIQVAADRALDALVDGLIQALDRGEPALVARMLGHAPDAEPDSLTWDVSFRVVAPRPARRATQSTAWPDASLLETSVAVLR